MRALICSELPRNCDDKDIKRAYRKKALEWHPDKHQDVCVLLSLWCVILAYDRSCVVVTCVLSGAG